MNSGTFKRIYCHLNMKAGFNTMMAVFAEQCTGVIVQRIRRTLQIVQFYGHLYSKQSVNRIVQRLHHGFNIQKKTRPIYLMFSAVMFSWEHEYITDEELNRHVLLFFVIFIYYIRHCCMIYSVPHEYISQVPE